ncbi:MAG TPA: glutaredoxin domain-containing protein [Chloroflexota bacterium]|nr:glutaredoxin domain-containing protein [Chloroflexota bacterium]
METTRQAAGTTIRVYGTSWCPDCIVARRVLDGFDVDYEWIDITGNDEAIEFVMTINRGYRSVPTIVLPGGRTMTEPSGRELTAVLLALGYQPK